MTATPFALIRQLIDQGGFGMRIDAINERNFNRPEDFLGGREPKVFSFADRTQFIETREVFDLMGFEGYRPAFLGDLVRFRVENPKDAMVPKLVALNAAFRSGDRDAAICLSGKMTPGIVDILGVLRDDDWDPATRFLGVRLPLGHVYCPPPTDHRLL